MKVLTLLGTRPEIIKLSAIMKKLDKSVEHIIVHTGQNYDYELNEIFYKDLDLRKPDYFLSVGGGTLAETIAKILVETEKVLIKEKPDAIVILGDTNSALGGIIAKRMKIPIFHLEAGNRCFDQNVPEEINRMILDHIGDVNMAYSENSRRYLLAEGAPKDRTFIMGSPMKEIFNEYLPKIQESKILDELKLDDYFLISIHRDENTEIKENLMILVDTLHAIKEKYNKRIIITAHPRFRKKLEELNIDLGDGIELCKPFGFFDYVKLQLNAKCVITDSGTIAEESTILKFPAVTIRNAVERPEAVDVGSLLITGVDKDSILRCIDLAKAPTITPEAYSVDNCSDRVLNVVLGYTPYVNKYVWHKR
jgi:UDP-N-acetylglucosamine 2-epimerase (non-hydrolysing)